MKKINENEVPAKFGVWGSRYLFNEPDFSAGSAVIIPGGEIAEHMHDDEKEFFILSRAPRFSKRAEKNTGFLKATLFLWKQGSPRLNQ